MNRFDCRFEKVAKKPTSRMRLRDGKIRLRTRELDVIVNGRTGLLDRYRVGGMDYLANGAGRLLVMRDNADPWGMTVRGFRRPAGRFRPMTQSEAARFAGISRRGLAPVRVIEDGPVRVVVEVLLSFGKSAVCQRYKLPRKGTELEMEIRVLWQEKDSMLKLSLPTGWPAGSLLGQVAYGAQGLPDDGRETVAQKWLAVTETSGARILTVINDSTYGCDFKNGELRLSLLRAPAHAGHPTGTGRPILQQDRFTPRIDQGEHLFRFWVNGGDRGPRMMAVDREALAHNERPYALAYWPGGEGGVPAAGPVLTGRAVQLAAFKKAEGGDDLIVRLFEPTGRTRTTTLSLGCLGIRTRVKMAPFEIKTLRVNRVTGRVREVSLLEE
jgi:alpha-mannosidase